MGAACILSSARGKAEVGVQGYLGLHENLSQNKI